VLIELTTVRLELKIDLIEINLLTIVMARASLKPVIENRISSEWFQGSFKNQFIFDIFA
jgi:hypothetical protein